MASTGRSPYDPTQDNPRKVFVYNLPWTVDWPDLKKYFKRAGQVIYANVMKEGGPTGRSKGCGVVEYETVDEATNAITLFNGIEMEGRTIYVRRDIKDPSERTFDHTPSQKRSLEDLDGGSSKRSRTSYGGGYGSQGMRNVGGSKFSGGNDMYGNFGSGMGMGMGGMKSGMGMGMGMSGNMGMAGMGMGGMGMGGMGGGYGGFNMRGNNMDMSGYGMDMTGGFNDSYDFSNRQSFGGGDAATVGKRVFVANLSYETTWQQLKDHFKQAGRVTFATILKDKEGKSRGCGLVEFDNSGDALRAISRLSNSVLGDRQISVREDQKEGSEPLRTMTPVQGGFGGRVGGASGFTGGAAVQQQAIPVQNDVAFAKNDMPELPGVLPGTNNSAPTGTQVVVHGLPFSYEWVHLKDMMRAAGTVAKADIVKDNTGKSKGYGIVRFESEQEALNAIEMFNNTALHGRIIHVKRDEFA